MPNALQSATTGEAVPRVGMVLYSGENNDRPLAIISDLDPEKPPMPWEQGERSKESPGPISDLMSSREMLFGRGIYGLFKQQLPPHLSLGIDTLILGFEAGQLVEKWQALDAADSSLGMSKLVIGSGGMALGALELANKFAGRPTDGIESMSLFLRTTQDILDGKDGTWLGVHGAMEENRVYDAFNKMCGLVEAAVSDDERFKDIKLNPILDLAKGRPSGLPWQSE